MNLLPMPRTIEQRQGTTTDATPRVDRDTSLPRQGYRLEVAPGSISIDAADDAGEFYARSTLEQLRKASGPELPCCLVTDWPDIEKRAVMLDIARDKVPTMSTLRDLIDRLASWKVNEVQLYMEHTFAYRDHEDVWRDASPVTAEEVAELDAFCRQRHVELVANQNCFGHMDRWLRHDRYRPLAMAPDGWIDARGRRKEPTTLDPANPQALELVRGLLSELLDAFTAPRVHVGLDEPWEMPPERFGEYRDWISRLRSLPELDGREMLIWGDIIAPHPEVLGELPGGVTVCEWGYEDWHPFDERIARMTGAGVPAWVAPGTSSWLTILGRVDNMVGDCAAAARAAVDHGATGFLNTDWGDLGHLQYLPVSEPGFAYGAAVSWCLESNRDLDLAIALDTHAFEDSSGEIGAALLELGRAYLGIQAQFPNVSLLVMHLYFPQLQLGRTMSEKLTIEDLEAVQDRLAGACRMLDRASPARADGGLVVDELRAGAELVSLLCRDAVARLHGDGWLASVPEPARMQLAAELDPMIDRHRQLWLSRNRPGGLPDSCKWLEHLSECYRSGAPDKYWGGW